jgi:Protein of unknown function (DUF3421)
VKDKMMNKKYVSGWLTALGIATVSLGSLATISQPALADYRWVAGKSGSVPAGAVRAGYDNNDELYVCRTNLGNGKLHPQYKNCYVPYGSTNQAFTTYEVLVGNDIRWVPWTGSIPHNAILAGYEPNGAFLHVCRANLRSGSTPGKYSAITEVCYLPYGGKYTETRTFDILVSGLEERSLTTSCFYSTGQVCDRYVAFDVRPSMDLSSIKLTAPSTHCSAVSYEVLHGGFSQKTRFLQPGESTQVRVRLSKGADYQLIIKAIGKNGGCNTGRLASWGVKAGLDSWGN